MWRLNGGGGCSRVTSRGCVCFLVKIIFLRLRKLKFLFVCFPLSLENCTRMKIHKLKMRKSGYSFLTATPLITFRNHSNVVEG